jgi:hypothetical protein
MVKIALNLFHYEKMAAAFIITANAIEHYQPRTG